MNAFDEYLDGYRLSPTATATIYLYFGAAFGGVLTWKDRRLLAMWYARCLHWFLAGWRFVNDGFKQLEWVWWLASSGLDVSQLPEPIGMQTREETPPTMPAAIDYPTLVVETAVVRGRTAWVYEDVRGDVHETQWSDYEGIGLTVSCETGREVRRMLDTAMLTNGRTDARRNVLQAVRPDGQCPTVFIPGDDRLAGMKKVELKALAKTLGLKQSGTNEQLRERIRRARGRSLLAS